MPKNIVVGLVVAFLIMGGAIFIVTGSDPSAPDSTMLSVDMSKIASNLDEEIQNAMSRQSMPNVVVLDVRTDAEWAESHATDAVHWGLAEKLDKGQLPPLGKNMEIYVYCRSGARAEVAIKQLQEAGYTNLTNIRGLSDWVAADGATTSGFDDDGLGTN